jgi:hypothetical protein
MRHDETRDNTTAIENQSVEADAHEDTREWSSEPDPAGVQLVRRTGPVGVDGRRRFGELPEVARKRIAREHDKIVAEARRESEERFEEINDGANGYDDEPEDDGQPSEYEEWQDYFGGDDYYDHSENEMW